MNEYGKVLKDADLTNLNTYKLVAKVKYLVYPHKDKLAAFIKYLKKANIKYFILGGGSNIILANSYYDGVFISLKKFNKWQISNDVLEAESGLNLNSLIKKVYDKGYNSLVNLYGIPGSLGGAIIGNAGAFKDEISNHIIDVTYLDKEGNLKTLSKDQINFTYRNSIFKNQNVIILKARLRLTNDENLDFAKVVSDNMTKRKTSQPLNYPSAGSVFKNPQGTSAGLLIDQCGLKGKISGGAQVSNKHANFIVNINQACAKDILDLIDIIKELVLKQHNIKLKLEQKIVRWENK